MQALGLIETRGLVVAVESADAMLKAADVTLLEKIYVGGGLVSISVTGEVAAVKAAVEAGAAAVRQINSALLMFQHVIPRPHEEMEGLIVSVKPLKDMKLPSFEILNIKPDVEAVVVDQVGEEKETMDLAEINKKTIDQIVLNDGLEEAFKFLSKLKVIKLRNLAREFKEFGIAGRLISKANKKMLLAEFNRYYKK
jgi:microcompartment protein CcmL/EutN